MLSNKLIMKDDKTEAIIIAAKRIIGSNSLPHSMIVGGTFVAFCQALKRLGVYFDSTLSLHQHVINTRRSAYIELRRMSSMPRLLRKNATKTLMCSFILSKLDKWNSLLTGAPLYLKKLLHNVFNIAARIATRAPKAEPTKCFLYALHWLPV